MFHQIIGLSLDLFHETPAEPSLWPAASHLAPAEPGSGSSRDLPKVLFAEPPLTFAGGNLTNIIVSIKFGKHSHQGSNLEIEWVVIYLSGSDLLCSLFINNGCDGQRSKESVP